MKVVIKVEGGMVQGVWTDAPEDIELEVLDLDVSDFASGEEKAIVEEMRSDLRNRIADGDLTSIY